MHDGVAFVGHLEPVASGALFKGILVAADDILGVDFHIVVPVPVGVGVDEAQPVHQLVHSTQCHLKGLSHKNLGGYCYVGIVFMGVVLFCPCLFCPSDNFEHCLVLPTR